MQKIIKTECRFTNCNRGNEMVTYLPHGAVVNALNKVDVHIAMKYITWIHPDQTKRCISVSCIKPFNGSKQTCQPFERRHLSNFAINKTVQKITTILGAIVVFGINILITFIPNFNLIMNNSLEASVPYLAIRFTNITSSVYGHRTASWVVSIHLKNQLEIFIGERGLLFNKQTVDTSLVPLCHQQFLSFAVCVADARCAVGCRSCLEVGSRLELQLVSKWMNLEPIQAATMNTFQLNTCTAEVGLKYPAAK